MARDKCISSSSDASLLSRRGALRFLFYSLVWGMLTGFDSASWILGFPTVLLAVWVSLRLSPPSGCSLSLAGLCSFIPFFLRQSALSGIDVMRRTLSPRLLVNPGLVFYTTYLPQGFARIFFVNTISLLPGTLSADLTDNRVTIHTIDRELPIWANIQNLELRIAVLLRVGKTKEKPR